MPTELVQVVSVIPKGSSKHLMLRRVSADVPQVPVMDMESPVSIKQIQQTFCGKEITALNGNGLVVESHDSCYSSCSEESHCSLSREPSDSITKDIAQLSTNDTDIESAATNVHSEQKQQEQILHSNIDFATRLGYSVEQLESVLQKLEPDAGRDQILNELIKLGRGAMDKGSGMIENTNVQGTGQSTQLRSIVIDGSNIAMTHGRKEIFSCRGIRECVQFFRNRGHTDIIVFVPQFRREVARSDCPITDQHILFELESENVLIWTPSRRINGRRIVCHDDRYILKTAQEKDAVIVSNDEYRDLIKENPQYRMLVDERLLMYSFVDGRFMPPDDPLGRHGPKLEQFLCKGSQASLLQLCPYARKCTYGNKCRHTLQDSSQCVCLSGDDGSCRAVASGRETAYSKSKRLEVKYYHPERPNGIHISVTDRLMKEKQRVSQPVSAIAQERTAHTVIVRTQSLNIPMSEKTKHVYGDKKLTMPLLSPHQEERSQPSDASPTCLPTSSMQPQQTTIGAPKLPPALALAHSSLDRQYSAPLNRCSVEVSLNPIPCLPSAPIIGCNASATTVAHYCYSRFAVVPPPRVPPPIYLPSPYAQLPFFTDSEQGPGVYQNVAPQQYLVTADGSAINESYRVQSRTSHFFTPSTAVWGEQIIRLLVCAEGDQMDRFGYVLPYRPTSEPLYPMVVNERQWLQNILCQLFPEWVVRAMMEAHPDENDPQKLCSLIITELQKSSGNTENNAE